MTREESIRWAAEGACLDWDHCIYFEEGAAWADANPNWISVEDELPETDDYILMYNGSFNEIHYGTYNDGVFEDYLGQFSEGRITHWMPIIPPRKEDKK